MGSDCVLWAGPEGALSASVDAPNLLWLVKPRHPPEGTTAAYLHQIFVKSSHRSDTMRVRRMRGVSPHPGSQGHLAGLRQRCDQRMGLRPPNLLTSRSPAAPGGIRYRPRYSPTRCDLEHQKGLRPLDSDISGGRIRTISRSPRVVKRWRRGRGLVPCQRHKTSRFVESKDAEPQPAPRLLRSRGPHARAELTGAAGASSARRLCQAYRNEIPQHHHCDSPSRRVGCGPCVLSDQHGCCCAKFAMKRPIGCS